jgi:hypothetical protein
MVEPSASVKFDSCVEGALTRLASERFQIALQIVASSINPAKLDQLQADLDRLPDDSPKKNAVDVPRIVEQLASVAPQIVALDLDRTTPLRILGIGRTTAPVLFSAQCFGHAVTLAGRLNFVTALLLKLYGVPCAEAKPEGELPEGPFDVIIAYGSPNLSTKQAWAEFMLPLAGRLTEAGRIFVALAPEANARRNYHPDIVLSKLAKMGARVSSKNRFILLDHAMLKSFGVEAGEPEHAGTADVRPEFDSSTPGGGLSGSPPAAERQHAVIGIRPNWKMGAALIGSFVILIGLLVATWSGH